MTRIILASGSPSRLSTLRAAGIEPLVRVSEVDEDAVVARYGVTAGDEVSLLLARAKAEDVARRLIGDDDEDAAGGDVEDGGATDDDSAGDDGASPEVLPGDFILGCDSVLDIDGVSYGKPGARERAREQWRLMRGRSAVLYSGHWLIRCSDGAARGASSATTVHLADIGDDEIEAYLDTDEPLQVAGALTIDGLGGAYITGIEGDHHGVIGLSLPLLRELFGRFDVRWHSLWNHRA